LKCKETKKYANQKFIHRLFSKIVTIKTHSKKCNSTTFSLSKTYREFLKEWHYIFTFVRF